MTLQLDLQTVIDKLLEVDADYRKNNGYYLGATDRLAEDIVRLGITEAVQHALEAVSVKKDEEYGPYPNPYQDGFNDAISEFETKKQKYLKEE